MTAPRTLDLSHLKPYAVSNKSPLWWGQLLMCFIEASMFFMMIGIYFYLRLSVDVWPPPGTQLPHITLPTLALIPLLLSGVASYFAGEAAKKDDRGGMLWGLIANVVLGFGFLALRFAEMRTFNFTWATDVHGSVVWSILILHSLDAVADLMYTLVLIAAIGLGRYGQRERVGVHADSVVWFFIIGIWLPFYVVAYWGPHLVGAPR